VDVRPYRAAIPGGMLDPEAWEGRSGMKSHTAGAERRAAIIWFVAALLFLIAMLGMWWLVEETNEEGTHDAELLPFFALIPMAIGAYHLVRSRWHAH
jgi:hypothetical protein